MKIFRTFGFLILGFSLSSVTASARIPDESSRAEMIETAAQKDLKESKERYFAISGLANNPENIMLDHIVLVLPSIFNISNSQVVKQTKLARVLQVSVVPLEGRESPTKEADLFRAAKVTVEYLDGSKDEVNAARIGLRDPLIREVKIAVKDGIFTSSLISAKLLFYPVQIKGEAQSYRILSAYSFYSADPNERLLTLGPIVSGRKASYEEKDLVVSAARLLE